jgi:hypothetical protein
MERSVVAVSWNKCLFWIESVEPQFQALRTGLARVVDPILLQVCALEAWIKQSKHNTISPYGAGH